MTKKKVISFALGLVLLVAVAGTWAYYNAEVSLDNELQTSQYGSELEEKFTPPGTWEPSQVVDKEVGVKNTGDYDLFVRVRMSETWTFKDGTTTHTIASTDPGFLTATALSAVGQLDPNDGLFSVAGPPVAYDQSVVYKQLAASGWTFNPADGYWYYNTKLAPGATTSNLLSSITLAGDTDMGLYTETKYYTTASVKPAPTAIGSDPTSEWVVYSGAVPANTTWTRSVSELNPAAPGYAGGTYTLTITSQILQGTKAAFDGTPAWSTTPTTVKTAWGV